MPIEHLRPWVLDWIERHTLTEEEFHLTDGETLSRLESVASVVDRLVELTGVEKWRINDIRRGHGYTSKGGEKKLYHVVPFDVADRVLTKLGLAHLWHHEPFKAIYDQGIPVAPYEAHLAEAAA